MEVEEKLQYYQQAILNAKPEDIKDVTLANEGYVKIEFLEEEKEVFAILGEKNEDNADDDEDECDDDEDKKNWAHKCLVCNERFKSSRKLSAHKIIHSTESFTCEKCGRTFSEKLRLNVHMRAHFTG